MAVMTLEIHPLTEDRFGDLEKLFGPAGACAGCWCMYFRVTSKDWSKPGPQAERSARNRKALKRVIAKGPPPGLLAYDQGEPVGWVQVTPRNILPRFNSERAASAPESPKTDLDTTWAVSCFFTKAKARGKGLTSALLKDAIKFAKAHGARAVEACPFDTSVKTGGTAALFVGVLPVFEKAGFKEVMRRLPHRPLVRKTLR
jgi:GNAT superfamily N-acetyltransferase